MKFLRSTFLAFYLSAKSDVAAFSPQIYTKSVVTQQRSNAVGQPSSTSLFVGIHEQPASQISEEEIQRDTLFREVLKEINTAKEYLAYLVEESGDASAADAEGEGQTFGDVLDSTAAAGEVELFGGGGDAPAETPKETQYQPSMRSDLGSTVLLSGTADATLLSVLNNNFFGQDLVPNFDFTKIRALVGDVAAAKKKAISREARYSGLLDKLVIEAASGDGSLPSAEELKGATSWIAQVSSEDAKESLPKIAELAKGSEDLTNVIVLVTGASSDSVEGWGAVVSASADDAFQATLLAVGELYESSDAGGFHHVGALGAATVDSPKISTKKAYQLLAHALSLDSTSGKALTAYEYPAASMAALAVPYAEGEFAVRDDDEEVKVDELKDVKMEGRLIQAIREVGFTQVMELDVLVDKGIAGCKEYIANPPQPKESSFTKTRTARDEEDDRIMAILEEETAKSEALTKASTEKTRRIGIEGIAREWAIKEYSLRMIGGDIDDSVSEKDFMVSVWEEALKEGEKTYERINTEEYKKDQERLAKSKKGTENKLFWEGMSPALRRKREKMVEKVKKQYMDLLSEEDLESIILNE